VSGRRVFSPRRFRELAVYVISKCPDGITVQQLWNVMFAIDFEAYRRLGRSITGAAWIKTEYGVVPGKYSRKTTPDLRLRENRA